MKKKVNKTQELKSAIERLHESFDSDEIFDALLAVSETSDRIFLRNSVISYLNIYEGMNVVKFDGLTQRMSFEESMDTIFPYQNDKQANLFLA